jgi:hypothetical protein
VAEDEKMFLATEVETNVRTCLRIINFKWDRIRQPWWVFLQALTPTISGFGRTSYVWTKKVSRSKVLYNSSYLDLLNNNRDVEFQESNTSTHFYYTHY